MGSGESAGTEIKEKRRVERSGAWGAGMDAKRQQIREALTLIDKGKDGIEQAAVELAVLQANLEEKGMRDWLTGALNGGAYKEVGGSFLRWERSHLEQEEPGKHGVGVAICDMDNFSAVAKVEGLDRGKNEDLADNAIRAMAEILRDVRKAKAEAKLSTRGWRTMRISRLGGDEFAVVADDVESEEFREMLEELRKTIEADLSQRAGIARIVPVQTASFGGVVVNEGTIGQAMAGAELALKQVKEKKIDEKEKGKNKVAMGMGANEIPTPDVNLKKKIEVDRTKRIWRLRHQFEPVLPKLVGEEQMSQFVDNLALEWDGLDQESRRDELTGLSHRGEGNILLVELLDHAREHGETVEAVLVDIKRFKSINTDHSYEGGNEVLREVGGQIGRLRDERSGAVAVRWRPGGQFMMALHGTEIENAETIRGRLRLGDRAAEWNVDFDVVKVTLTGQETLAEAIKKLDEQMLIAKKGPVS